MDRAALRESLTCWGPDAASGGAILNRPTACAGWLTGSLMGGFLNPPIEYNHLLSTNSSHDGLAISIAHFSIPPSNTPCPRTYWVLEGLFLAGAFAGKPDPQDQIVRLSELLDAGIRTFINLMEEDERNPQGMLFAPYDGVLNQIAS